MLYVCPNCQNSFTDLDVDRLLDPVEQVLKYGLFVAVHGHMTCPYCTQMCNVSYYIRAGCP